MLSNRECLILKYYSDNINQYIASEEIAAYVCVSVRTIKKDIINIKYFLSKNHPEFEFISIRGKGTKLFTTEKKHINKLSKIIDYYINIDKPTEQRANQIIEILIISNTYISKYHLLNKLNISESSLYISLLEAKKEIEKFDLKINQKTNLGYKILGSEINIRTLIVQMKYYNINSIDSLNSMSTIENIYNSVANAFLCYKYQIDEQTLNTITFNVALAIKRVSDGNTLTYYNYENIISTAAYSIAKKILSKHLIIYNLNIEEFESEINLLSLTILGKTSLTINKQLQESVNNLIDLSLSMIHDNYSIDFSLDEKLKLSLSLHRSQLIYRLKSGTQLKNNLSSNIKQEFPLSYDISKCVASIVEDKYDEIISDDECSFLTLYFKYGIEKNKLDRNAKKLLILTDIRNSETALIKYKLNDWFPNQIASIDFSESLDKCNDLTKYDTIFSTYDNLDEYKGSVCKISKFPDNRFYDKINLAINGYTDVNSIISKFSEQCFYFGNAKDKDEALDIVINNAIKKYNLDDNFFETIKSRELVASSFFGDFVAIPHPLIPNTNDTFVSIGILSKPIKWDSHNTVKFIFLVSIEKNNPKALQFWYYISSLVRNKKILQGLELNPNYNNMIEMLKRSLNHYEF
jgi:lichenan operon transcriptional antiterminator